MDKELNIKHIAIIMDGNGRWAQLQGQKRTYGHQHGVEAVRSVVEGACELQIPYLMPVIQTRHIKELHFLHRKLEPAERGG